MRVAQKDLTDENTNGLALLAKAGDQRAAAELVRVMRPILISLIRKNGYSADQRDEQEAAALVGLWAAVTAWDPEHTAGKPFKLVAWYRMRHEIDEWCAKNSGALPMPRSGAWRKAPEIDQALEDYAAENPGRPFPEDTLSDEELDRVTGVRNTRAVLRARQPAWPVVMDHDAGMTASAEDYFMDASEESLQAATLELVKLLGDVEREDWPYEASKFADIYSQPEEFAQAVLRAAEEFWA